MRTLVKILKPEKFTLPLSVLDASVIGNRNALLSTPDSLNRGLQRTQLESQVTDLRSKCEGEQKSVSIALTFLCSRMLSVSF